MSIRACVVEPLVVATLIAPSLVPLRTAAQSGRSDPVAARREVAAAVIQEAYDKFTDETGGGKNADCIPERIFDEGRQKVRAWEMAWD